MISPPAQTRIFLHRSPTDMRKSFAGLVALTESVLQEEPTSGHLFLFFNRRGDRVKVLYWGGTGFCIWYQQLERGTFQIPLSDVANDQAKLEISSSQLSLILHGIDLNSARQRKRYSLHRSATENKEVNAREVA